MKSTIVAHNSILRNRITTLTTNKNMISSVINNIFVHCNACNDLVLNRK